MIQWQQFNRKIRFTLPEICVYEKYHPFALITKKKENSKITYVKNQAKMNPFKVQKFFKQGYIMHLSNKLPKLQIKTHSQTSRNQCIILAKYKYNRYCMLTLLQLQGLFKAKHKDLRQGLMYLQTLVGGKYYNEIRIRINLRQMIGTQLYHKAQNEIRIIIEQIKTIDNSYYTELEEINYQNQLKQKNLKEYLTYLSLKIILLYSKKNQFTWNQCLFKWVYTNEKCYLWDVRIKSMQPSITFWTESSVIEAYEYKLKHTMSLMQIPYKNIMQIPYKNIIPQNKRTKQIQKWLQISTELQFKQIQMIKNRLQKLQKQKRSLIQSQSQQINFENKYKIKPNKISIFKQHEQKKKQLYSFRQIK